MRALDLSDEGADQTFVSIRQVKGVVTLLTQRCQEDPNIVVPYRWVWRPI